MIYTVVGVGIGIGFSYVYPTHFEWLLVGYNCSDICHHLVQSCLPITSSWVFFLIENFFGAGRAIPAKKVISENLFYMFPVIFAEFVVVC